MVQSPCIKVWRLVLGCIEANFGEQILIEELAVLLEIYTMYAMFIALNSTSSQKFDNMVTNMTNC